MKRKILIVFLTVCTFCLALFGLIACGGVESSSSSEETKELTLNYKTLVMTVDDEETLVAYYGENACVAAWESSATEIVSVDDNGKITALQAGRANVTATYDGKSAVCYVLVEEKSSVVPVLTFVQESLIVRGGTDFTLNASLTLNGQSLALPETLVYASSDTDVLTVTKTSDGNALLHGVAACDTPVIVTATCEYEGETLVATCEVLVTENVVLTLSSPSLTLAAYEYSGQITSSQITVNVEKNGVEIDSPVIVWTSENEEVATVVGGMVTAVTAGETHVNAVWTDNGKEYTASVGITVYAPEIDFTEGVQNVYLDETDGENTLDVGTYASMAQSVTLKAYDVTESEAEITATQSGGVMTLDRRSLKAGERMISVRVEGKISFLFRVDVITKIITDYEQLVSLESYSGIENGATDYTYGGYFVLGNNIDLTGKTVSKYLYTGTADEKPTKLGFAGIFDGKGYTLFGGQYDSGGLFGALAESSIVRNLAIVNVTLHTRAWADKTPCVFGTFLCGKMENLLVDVAKQSGTNALQSAWGGSSYGARLKNCVTYYPGGATKPTNMPYAICQYAFGYNHDGIESGYSTTENVYCISDSMACDPAAQSPYFNAVTYPKDTLCSEIDFNDFDDGAWVFTGNKAMFKSTQDFIYALYEEIPFDGMKELVNGETLALALPKAIDGDAIWSTSETKVSLTQSELSVSKEIDGNFTFALSVSWNGSVVRTETVTVSKAQALNGVDYELYTDLTENKEKIANDNALAVDFGAQGVTLASGTWKLKDRETLTIRDITQNVSVSGSVATISNLSALFDGVGGEYSLLYKAGTETVWLPLTVANKIIRTANDLANIVSYSKVYNQGTWSLQRADGTYNVFNACTYDGYFVLGNNIDLSERTVFNGASFTTIATNDGKMPTEYGFAGTFDGRGYTLFGGKYDNGGIFGAIAETGIVKNLAIVNAGLYRASLAEDTDKPAIFGRTLAGKLDNVLIDVADYDLNGGMIYSVAAYILGGEITNSVIVQANPQTFAVGVTNQGQANEVVLQWVLSQYSLGPGTGHAHLTVKDGKAENVYAISDAPNVSSMGVAELRGEDKVKRFAYGTVCADVAFEGLADFWDFDGDKPVFESTVEFLKSKVKEEQIGKVTQAYKGESFEISAFNQKTFTVTTDNELITVVDGTFKIADVVDNTTNVNISFDWNGITIDTLTITVSQVTQVLVQETTEYELYSSIQNGTRVANTANLVVDLTAKNVEIPAGIAWELKKEDTSVSVTEKTSVNGKVITVTDVADLVNGIGGEYTLVGITNRFYISVPVKLINKVITTAQDLANIVDYSTKSNETTWTGTTNATFTYDGYFVLGGNIDLSQYCVQGQVHIAKAAPYTDAKKNGNVLPSTYGFTGTFDGRGYTVYGGIYDGGGLFGAIAKTGVVKNVALVGLSKYAHGVLGYTVCGTVDNVLIDVSTQLSPNAVQSVFAWSVIGGSYSNIVIRYNGTSDTHFAFADYTYDGRYNTNYDLVDASETVSTSNIYVFTNKGYNGNYANNAVHSGIVRKTLSDTCASAGLVESETGFNAYWDFSGAVPAFKSQALAK